MDHAYLPDLPPSIAEAVRQAAHHIVATSEEINLDLQEDYGGPSAYLYSILYLLKQECQQVTRGSGIVVDPVPMDELNDGLNDILAELKTNAQTQYPPAIEAAQEEVEKAMADLETATEVRVKAFNRLEKARLKLATLIDNHQNS